MIRIGTANSQFGQLIERWIHVTELPTGDTEKILIIIEGTEDGATLWITGSIHGDEVTGLVAAQDVVNQALAERLTGTVVCLPNLNSAGFRQISRN